MSDRKAWTAYRRGMVLVVDDDPTSRKIMRAVIEEEGHEVREAESGDAALAILSDPAVALPDTILLDVLMPGMDGYETCSRIKSDPLTAHVPVIVVTALNKREDRLKAIDCGATDYFSKPIDADEVALRIRNAVRANQLFKRTQADLVALRDLERLRDTLIQMVVHDMRQPIASLSGYVHVMRGGRDDESFDRNLKMCQGLISRLASMIETVLDVQKMESGSLVLKIETVDYPEFVSHTIAELAESPLYNRSIELDVPPGPLNLECDPQLIRRVLHNLVDNATKHTPRSERITVAVRAQEETLRTIVTDSGPGIAPKYHSVIFEKYAQLDMKGSDSKPSWGLGLAFCKIAVTAHSGTIGVISEPGRGSSFWFELPAKQRSGG